MSTSVCFYVMLTVYISTLLQKWRYTWRPCCKWKWGWSERGSKYCKLLSYKASISLSQRWPLNTGLTVLLPITDCLQQVRDYVTPQYIHSNCDCMPPTTTPSSLILMHISISNLKKNSVGLRLIALLCFKPLRQSSRYSTCP